MVLAAGGSLFAGVAAFSAVVTPLVPFLAAFFDLPGAFGVAEVPRRSAEMAQRLEAGTPSKGTKKPHTMDHRLDL